MKRLGFTTAFILAIASSVPVALAEGALRDAKVSHLVHSGAHPNNTRLPATHHFEVHVQGGDLSRLTIDVPEGIKVSDRVVVTDESGKKIDAAVSVNERRITIAFSQPVPTKTTLSVSMKRIRTKFSSRGRVWLYPMYARKVGLTEDIRIGMARI